MVIYSLLIPSENDTTKIQNNYIVFDIKNNKISSVKISGPAENISENNKKKLIDYYNKGFYLLDLKADTIDTPALIELKKLRNENKPIPKSVIKKGENPYEKYSNINITSNLLGLYNQLFNEKLTIDQLTTDERMKIIYDLQLSFLMGGLGLSGVYDSYTVIPKIIISKEAGEFIGFIEQNFNFKVINSEFNYDSQNLLNIFKNTIKNKFNYPKLNIYDINDLFIIKFYNNVFLDNYYNFLISLLNKNKKNNTDNLNKINNYFINNNLCILTQDNLYSIPTICEINYFTKEQCSDFTNPIESKLTSLTNKYNKVKDDYEYETSLVKEELTKEIKKITIKCEDSEKSSVFKFNIVTGLCIFAIFLAIFFWFKSKSLTQQQVPQQYTQQYAQYRPQVPQVPPDIY